MVAIQTFQTGLLALAAGMAALLIGCGQASAPKGSQSAVASSTEKSTDAKAPVSQDLVAASGGTPAPTKTPEPSESKAARAAFDRLIKAERDEDPQAWIAADQELTALGKEAAGVLGQGLASPEVRTREFAAMLLARLGPDAAAVEPQLTKALDDESPMVQANAGASLSLFGSQAERVIPLFQKLLKEENPTVRKIALYSLGNYGSQGEAAVSTIVPFLEHSDAELRMAAVVTLGNIGPNARVALARLESLAKEESSNVAPIARDAIARINAAEAKSETADTSSPFQKFAAETAAFATPAKLMPEKEAPATLADDESAEAELSEPSTREKSTGRPAIDIGPSAPKSGGPSLLGPGVPPSKE